MRFGRFDEVLLVTSRPKADVQAGIWDFAQGYAHLKQATRTLRSSYLGRVKKAAETSKASFRMHSAKDLLGIAAGILEGEMQRMDGDLSDAIKSFRRAAELQNGLQYDEPEPLPFAAHHWLGAA